MRRAPLFLLLSAAASAPAAEPAIDRILVLNLSASGVEENLVKNLSEVFAAAIREALPQVTVLGQSEVNSMLAVEKQRDLLGCADSVSCLAEIGGALGADHLAT